MVNQFAKNQFEFSVDFNDAWEWIGYSRKDNALRTLKDNFIENIDYILIRSREEKPQYKPSSEYMITPDCFKQFAMIAKTENGKKIRLYFIEAEKELVKIKFEPTPAAAPQLSTLDILALTVKSLQEQSQGINQLNSKVSFIETKLQQQDIDKQKALLELKEIEYSDKLPFEVPVRKKILAIVTNYIYFKFPSPEEQDFNFVWVKLSKEIYNRLGHDIETRKNNAKSKGIKKTRLDIMSDLGILDDVYNIVSDIFRVDNAD